MAPALHKNRACKPACIFWQGNVCATQRTALVWRMVVLQSNFKGLNKKLCECWERKEMGALYSVAVVYVMHEFGRQFVMYNCTLYTHKYTCTVCCTTSVQHQVEKYVAALFPWKEGKRKRTRKNHPYNHCSHFYESEWVGSTSLSP